MAKTKRKETRTYKLIELVGTSSKSYEEAISNAVKDASATLKGLAWFEVDEMRGRIDGDAVVEFQVKVRVAFKIIH